ncbi:unnamed protein product [Urochloa humidicola]
MAVALWWPLAAWFLFFNAVVGAIALMSCSSTTQQTPPPPARRRLCRSGSSMLLDQLRSFSIFAVHPVAGGVAMEAQLNGDGAAAADAHFYCYGTREAEAAAAATRVIAPVLPEPSSQAMAAPPGETAVSSAAIPSVPVAPAPAYEEDCDTPVALAPENKQNDEKPEAKAEEEAEQDESISLDEAYALAQRRRAQDHASAPLEATTPMATAQTKKPVVKKAAAAEGVSRRRRNKAEDALDGKAELNARAEMFIRQFREELKLQRLNSILSHAHALRSPTAARPPQIGRMV